MPDAASTARGASDANDARTAHHNQWSRANLVYQLYRVLLGWRDRDVSAIPTAPVVVGATGGSGTRALVQALQLAGFWMGAWVNPETEDAMATRHFLQRHFTDLLREPEGRDRRIEWDFRRAIASHRHGMPDTRGPWGWKNPRNMWVIPFLARQFPGMRFVHLVRDGRDMAMSANRNLLRKHGDLLLPDRDWRSDPIGAQLKLWAIGNRLAHEAGQRLLGDAYLVLRYEDLCGRPEEALGRLTAFLNLDPSIAASVSSLVRPSSGIGRWKTGPELVLRNPEPSVAEVLARFGYL